MSDADRTKLALLMLNCFLASTLGKQVGCTRVAPDVPQKQGTILYETQYSWYTNGTIRYVNSTSGN